MADTAIAITAGTGTNVDTRTEGTNGNHRQVVVIGDPATNAGVAPVDATYGVGANILGVNGGASDFASQTTLALIKAKTDNLDAATSTLLTISDFDTKTGSLTETAPATDTASSGVNGRLQRIAQRLTSLIALLPTALGAGGGLKVDGSGTALPVSGTVTANAGTNLNTSALALDSTLTGGTQQAKLTDGTNIVNILKSDGTAVGQNAQLVAGTGMGSGTLTLNLGSPATSWYDMINYPWVSIEILTNSSAATLTFQTSGDSSQTNIRTTSLQDSQNLASPTATSTSSAVATLHGPRTGRYFRVSSNVSGANTVTLVLTFYTTQSFLQTYGVQAAQSGAWTVGSSTATGSAVPANAFYGGLNTRTSSPTAASNGNLVGLTGSVMGEALVATGGLVTTAVAVSASNTVVKATPGRLCNVLVTTTGVTGMIIYDNATTNSGTIIGMLPASPAVGTTYTFNMPAAAGITVAGSATNPAVTVSWI